MPLKGIPNRISPELLYTLARMGHGDFIVIADANFPSDSIARSTRSNEIPIRISGSTAEVLGDILELLPLDQYMEKPLAVMDRVDSDKAKELHVPAYEKLASAAGVSTSSLDYIERFAFYELAKTAFAVIQTDDKTLYANAIIYKGVL
jgi:L-fucose mutarotase